MHNSQRSHIIGLFITYIILFGRKHLKAKGASSILFLLFIFRYTMHFISSQGATPLGTLEVGGGVKTSLPPTLNFSFSDILCDTQTHILLLMYNHDFLKFNNINF